MNAPKNEPPSSRRDSTPPPSAQQHADAHANPPALFADALSSIHRSAHSTPSPGLDPTLPPELQTADRILRRAAAQPTQVKVPDGLAERTVAKCLTLALDGSMAGEVVV